jgi:hypothetical protein
MSWLGGEGTEPPQKYPYSLEALEAMARWETGDGSVAATAALSRLSSENFSALDPRSCLRASEVDVLCLRSARTSQPSNLSLLEVLLLCS